MRELEEMSLPRSKPFRLSYKWPARLLAVGITAGAVLCHVLKREASPTLPAVLGTVATLLFPSWRYTGW